jgi:hypothetical protein
VGIAPLDRLSKNVRFFSGSLAEVTAEVEAAGNPPTSYTPLGTVPAIFGLFNASKLTRDCENALATTE